MRDKYFAKRRFNQKDYSFARQFHVGLHISFTICNWIHTREFSEKNAITFLRMQKILIFGQAVANSQMQELI